MPHYPTKHLHNSNISKSDISILIELRLHPEFFISSYSNIDCNRKLSIQVLVIKPPRRATQQWKQTDKSRIGIPNWGFWVLRVWIWDCNYHILDLVQPHLQALLLDASGTDRWWYIFFSLAHWGQVGDSHCNGLKPWAVIVRLRRINCCAWTLIVVDCSPIVVLGMFSDKLPDDRTL